VAGVALSGCAAEDAGSGAADTSGPGDGSAADTPSIPDTTPAIGEEDASTPDAATVEAVSRWPVGACDDQPAGTGVAVGDIAMAFEMLDQHGQMVRLHDFCDKTILLVGSAFWCPGCVDKAPSLDAIYQAHRDEGLLIITLLTETLDGQPCAQEDLAEWADEYGQTFPVLSDVDGYIHTFTPKAGGKLPMEILLGPGVEILTVIDDITEQDLIEILP